MNIRNFLGTLTLSGSLLAGVVSVEAECSITGRVAQLALTPTHSTVVVAPLPNLSAPYYLFNIPVETMVSGLGDAEAGNLTVAVQGNAVSCPDTGDMRDGGTILSVHISKKKSLPLIPFP